MKKLIVLIGIAFCLATYSLPLCAEKDKNTEEKNITLIVDGDTIDCSQTLLDKYGSEKIIQAYHESGLVVNTINSCQRSKWVFKKQKSVIIISLIRQENKIIEITSSPILGGLYINWFIIILCVFLFFLFLLAILRIKYIFHYAYKSSVLVLLVLVGFLFYVLIKHGFWLVLGYSIISIVLGILCGYFYNIYFYNRKKAKRV